MFGKFENIQSSLLHTPQFLKQTWRRSMIMWHVHVSPHVRLSKSILDYEFHAVDSGFQVLDSGFSGIWILDSNCQRDSGFLELVSGFQSPGFQIPQEKLFLIAESGFTYIRRHVDFWNQSNQFANKFCLL